VGISSLYGYRPIVPGAKRILNVSLIFRFHRIARPEAAFLIDIKFEAGGQFYF
jgi:hypothetical protein